MTTVEISSVAGIVLSLFVSYFPGVNTWYQAMTADSKRLVMLILLLLVVAGAYALSCLKQGVYFTCDLVGFWTALRAFIAAAIANQTTYLLIPQPKPQPAKV